MLNNLNALFLNTAGKPPLGTSITFGQNPANKRWEETLPDFLLKNEPQWQEYIQDADFYSRGILSYAAKWAALMEEKMAQGEALENIAKQTSYDADNEGISGNGYSAAVEVLSEVWTHGEALRQWHNAKYNYYGAGIVQTALFHMIEAHPGESGAEASDSPDL